LLGTQFLAITKLKDESSGPFLSNSYNLCAVILRMAPDEFINQKKYKLGGGGAAF
jgi:hypothetical protein